MPFDPFNTDLWAPTGRPLKQEAQMQADPEKQKLDLQPLGDEEEDNLLYNAGSRVLAGVGYVGGLLDKYTGGRAVRGILGGNLREAASVLPFSDTLGITDEQQAVSGKQLLQNAGLLDKDDDSLWGTIAGAGTEIALNPATYLSFGSSALTEAGQAAAKVGELPTSLLGRIKGFSRLANVDPAVVSGPLADIPSAAIKTAANLGVDPESLIGKPLGAIANVHLPFMHNSPLALLGANEGGANLVENVGKGLNYLGTQTPLKYPVAAANAVLEPLGRYGRALFSGDAGGMTSQLGQDTAKGYNAAVESGTAEVRGEAFDAMQKLQKGGLYEDAELVRQAAENPNTPLPGQTPEYQVGSEVGEDLRAASQARRERLANLGMDKPDKLQYDPVTHQPIEYSSAHSSLPPVSSWRDALGQGGAQSGPALPLSPSALGQADPMWQNIPGGRATANAMSVDPDVSGVAGRLQPAQVPNLEMRAKLIRERYLGFSPEDEADAIRLQAQAKGLPASGQSLATDNPLFQGPAAAENGLTPAEQNLLDRHSQSYDLANRLASLDKQYADTGTPLFNNHPIEDFMNTGKAEVKQEAALHAVHQMIADSAVPLSEAPPNSSPLNAELFQKLGMTAPEQALAHQSELLLSNGKIGQTGGSIPQLFVPPDVLADATRFNQGHTLPRAIAPLVHGLDWVTNLTKAWETGPWPGFWARNFTSGQFMNFVKGASDPRYTGFESWRSYAQPIKDAYDLIQGKTVAGAADLPHFAGMGLTDEQATAEIAKNAFMHRVLAGGGQTGEILGPTQGTKLLGQIPGQVPFDPLEVGKEFLKDVKTPAGWNPVGVAGVAGYNTDANAFVKSGRELSGAVDDVNRLSAYIAKLRQGEAFDVAGSNVRGMHVDYDKLTGFERNVMRRVLPFYSYHRGIIPAVLDELAQNPGGLAGQYAMQSNLLRQNSKGFVPEYLGGGLALPLGGEDKDTGMQRFLTRIDNPVEASFDPIGNSVQDTALGLLGQTNPVFKGPLEFATGKQFFTGRDLGDLYPITGSTLADQAIMNSPASRAFTTARTLMDERKGLGIKALNLTTGIHVSDVDIEKARDLAARDYIKDELQGQNQVGRSESFYARPDEIENLTPDQIAMLRLQKALDKRGKTRAATTRTIGGGAGNL